MSTQPFSSPANDADAAVAQLFLTPAGRIDPYPIYDELRRTAPVHRANLGMWLLSRYDDCWAAMRDPRLGTDYASQIEQRFGPDWRSHPSLTSGEHSMLNTSGPEHTRLRKLVTKSFTPRVIDNLKPVIERVVEQLLDPIAEAGGGNVLEAMGFPLPVTIIGEMMGVPEEDRQQFRVLVRDLVAIFEMQPTAECSTEQLEQLGATAYAMSFEPGDVLCAEGAESPECYVIEEGQAVVTIGRKGGRAVGEGAVVGERGVLLDAARSATVTATTHMLTCAISRERLKALVAADATVRAWMLEEVARRYPDGR